MATLAPIVLLSLLQVISGTNPTGTVVIPHQGHPGCGRILAIAPRPTAGDEVVHGSHPWVASIQYNGQHQCEGVLISPDWIVTTARCLNNVPISDIRVVLGDHQHGAVDGPEQTFSLQNVVIHSQYLTGTGRDSNDIALARVAQSVNMSSVFANTVCMPRTRNHGQFVSNTHCQHAGWGLQVSQNMLVSVVGVRVLTDQQCGRFWGDQVNGDTHLCINDTDTVTHRPRCEYGSGSPVICYDSESRARFVGLWSFGDLTCGRRPYVYTRVAYYRNWIHYMTGLSFPN